MSKSNEGKVKHKLQGGKGIFLQLKAKPLFSVGYVILSRSFKGRDDLCDLATTYPCRFCYNGVIVLNEGSWD
jgi:hypothetical protein